MIVEQLELLDSPASTTRDYQPPEQGRPPCSVPADRCAVSPLGRHQLVDLSSLHYLPSRFCSWCGRSL